MVRTRSDCSGVRIGTKASFKCPASSSSGSSSGKSARRGGGGGCSGNRYCPRETPPWQKEITKFFNTNAGQSSSASSTDEGASSSTSNSTE